MMKNELPREVAPGCKPRRKTRVDFGRQIRSYVLDRDEVIDHRTGKRASAKDVLDGNIDVLKA